MLSELSDLKVYSPICNFKYYVILSGNKKNNQLNNYRKFISFKKSKHKKCGNIY